jgi:hypothetical protein
MTAMELLLKEIDEKRDALQRAMADGAAKDYAMYRELCGEIRGLSTAHMFVSDLVRRMENDE